MMQVIKSRTGRDRLRRRRVFLIILLSVFLVSSFATAQTCSCAGAPLISSQSYMAVSKGNLLVGLTWEHNNISDLYNGTQELTNRSQQRITNTALLEVNYGLSNHFFVTGTLTFINKQRTTGLQNSSGEETTSTQGIGDGLLMLKYNLLNQSLWNPYQLSVGAGAKIPIAKTSLQSNGLSLNADMQPGTGAWDGVGWFLFSRTFRSANINLHMNGSYRSTGTNTRFNASDRYKFGNEFVSVLGVSGPMADRFSYSIIVKYRTTSSDKRNGNVLPNTGGEWLNFRPGVGYPLSDRLSIQLNGEIPLYQNLKGTQPTTSYILSGSLFFYFNKSETGFNYGHPGSR
ncbi:hypothetical protein SAMN06265218_105234 [Fodinibius sediminis]|uniref:MetA-pathway of phenol degradation n=2 Tax=Fodinibius sediminis TaxID=1214077 RepID=A0A521CBF2_9BACT|nr:hypothetical protein SAMN06265218_105234 [Fodinibius sediminis]